MRQAEHCVVRAGLKTARLLSRMIQLQLRPEFAEQFGGMNQLKREWDHKVNNFTWLQLESKPIN